MKLLVPEREKMKFLLCAVNAKYIHSNPAVYSLRAYAGEEMRSSVEVAEYTINQQKGEILADIYRRQPDAIGFSCYIWNWALIRELIVEVAKVLPEADIWLGGPEVTYDADRLLAQFPQLKGVMVGEGEETFRELLEYYVNRKGLRQVAGLCLPDGYTPIRPLTDMSALPFLYENMQDEDLEEFTNRIIYYESSRGCPYRCSYCLSSIDKKVRLRNISVVKKELQFFLDRKVPQVKFVDRTFNCDHDHAMAVWTYILEHDNGVTNFHFEISADILREDEIALLRRMRPGLVQLEIGVQSANPETIRAINRVMNLDKLEKIVATIREGNNIHQHLDLIAGLPFEDYESFGRSFDRVYGMRPQQLQLGFLKVLKGSEMQERAKEFGICYQSAPPYEVLYTDWLSYGDVLRLKRIEEMVELYYNSNQFMHTLCFLEKAFSTSFAMYEALAAFYEEQGYVTNSPARAYRYQVLLAFAEKVDPAYADVYRELLTFDLYLRENVKSRPEWAVELAPYKEQIRRFYQEEEGSRKYLPGYRDYDSRQMAKMTHLEPFFYPVWDAAEMERVRGEVDDARSQEGTDGQDIAGRADSVKYVLFDYHLRNPLTFEAKTLTFGVANECRVFYNIIEGKGGHRKRDEFIH